MADKPQAGGGPAPQGKPVVATTANWIGAGVSLALVVGVGVWGYNLLSRDVGGIPVIKSSGLPMRVAPKDPGGEQADNQGLAVNKVAGFGTAAPVADRVILAPQRVTLAPEDQPVGQIVVEPTVEPAIAFGADVQLTSLQEVSLADADKAEALQLLADEIAAGTAPFEQADLKNGNEVKVSVAQAKTVKAGNAAVAPEAGLGLSRSLRPQVRPSGLQTASLAPIEPQQGAVLDVDPNSVPAGTRLVQLGAFESDAVARTEWDRLNGRFSEFMEGKQRVIQRATSGGRVFYRLRAMGFADLSDARRFCATLVAAKADCIPVTSK